MINLKHTHPLIAAAMAIIVSSGLFTGCKKYDDTQIKRDIITVLDENGNPTNIASGYTFTIDTT